MGTLSIVGMYNYDPSIFDGFNVPEGMTKETVVNNILLSCAELEILYSRPEIMKLAIGVWSDSNQIVWNKLYNTMTVEYNPLWNVDADIVETGSGNRNIARHNQGTGSDNQTIDMTDVKSVQGFNSNEWAAAEKNETDGTNNRALASTEDESVAETSGDTRSIRRTGNIGVTSSQQLIQAEREVAEFNMVKYITDSFKKSFCIMIY